MQEEWKDIVGYEGLYQVSNLGRVKSLKYGKEKILKPHKNKGGYLYVNLYKNEKTKFCRVHRLIAQAFLHNPNNLPQINHKDENKENNNVTNLEWCDNKYNSNYGTCIERSSKSRCKKVIGINKTTGYITEFSSITEVGKMLGINCSNISACCQGKRKSAGNYYWFYANKEVEENE